MRTALAALATLSVMSGFELPVEGNAASKVRVVIYEDLQCPDCADFRVMMDRHLLPKFEKQVAFEHRDFPLPKHAWARQAAVAARMMAEKSPQLALEWRRYALGHIKEINASGDFKGKLLAWAKQHGLDTASVTAALEDAALNAAVEKDFKEGLARGVAKTPTVFVDGEPFVESFPLEEISSAIERALK